jgi:chaperonin GroEL
MVTLNKPSYILYHGRLNDIYTCLPIFDKINEAAQAGQLSPNVVLVATGFSEVVLAHLATNFRHPGTINVYPLSAPLNAMATGQFDFLADLAALTGGTIFDPLNAPLDNAVLEQLGVGETFEAGRFRSTVLGYKDEILVLERVDDLKKQLAGDISELDRSLIQERIGKISGGIAKLKVVGSSSGEVREKRDRAEDAICAVRGALKHGALPGGGWTLLNLSRLIATMDDDSFTPVELQILRGVLTPSLTEPVYRLFTNAGYVDSDEIDSILQSLSIDANGLVVYDVLEGKVVDAEVGGILDSTPAVLEAIRNSISIASLLGTCGGAVVFKRDLAVERQEARDTADFIRNMNVNEADERA